MSTALKRYTVAEYLAMERASQTKHEFFDGEVFAMAGGTAAHSLIGQNVGGELRGRLKGTPCQVYQSDMRILCPSGLRTYPDVSVACGAPEFEDEQLDTLLNPRVIVEVLSRSTERYDKSEKFENYESIPSLREYVLIRQDRMRVEHYVRQEGAGEWLLKSITDPAASLCFPSLGCEVPLAEIYWNVSLSPQHLSLHAGDDAATF